MYMNYIYVTLMLTSTQVKLLKNIYAMKIKTQK